MAKTNDNKNIMAININRLLNLKGKTRNEACDEMGIKYSTFTEWANGRKYPRIDKIEMMAEYFGTSKTDLIEAQPTNDKYSYKEIGLLLKNKRQEKGLTQSELGEILGVGNTAVYKWEKGIVRNIKRSTIQALAEILGISPLSIVGFREETKRRIVVEEDEVTAEQFAQIEQFINFIKSQNKQLL